jgi:hypothetical protein
LNRGCSRHREGGEIIGWIRLMRVDEQHRL